MPLKKQLILSLVLPHFDYASIVFLDLDKTRTKQLQVAHNACIRFIFGYIPYIPTSNVSTHLTQKRLELGWLSLTGRRHLQLAMLIYKTIATNTPPYLANSVPPLDNTILSSRSLRLPPCPFDFKSPRTKAWKHSFTTYGRSFLCTLVVTVFDPNRPVEFKNWLYTLFLKHEIDKCSSKASRKHYTSTDLISLLPHPNSP